MEKLIELRKIIELKKEKAEEQYFEAIDKKLVGASNILEIRINAFSEVINECYLILNNSVVKPSERRSPTDESFSGCKPPERKAKSTEENLECKCSPNQMCSNCVSKFSHIC